MISAALLIYHSRWDDSLECRVSRLIFLFSLIGKTPKYEPKFGIAAKCIDLAIVDLLLNIKSYSPTNFHRSISVHTIISASANLTLCIEVDRLQFLRDAGVYIKGMNKVCPDVGGLFRPWGWTWYPLSIYIHFMKGPFYAYILQS